MLCWCFVGGVLVFCWWRVSGVLVGRRQHGEQPIVEQRGRWEVG
jgi:hypothetical protein